MNNFPNVLNVAKAVKHRSTFPLDFQHLTTLDFGKTSVLHAMEVTPGDEIDIDMSSMIQFAPMVVPTMSEVNLYVRAFFVPYRFIWKDWEDFFSTKSTATGSTRSINEVPYISSYELGHIIFDNQYYAVHTDGDAYDFINDDSAQTSDHVKWLLTPLGRLYYQILLGLGYSLHPLADSQSGFEKFSALPLLALTKVFRDYYVNPNYDYTDIDAILTNFTSSYLQENQIIKCLQFIAFGWYEGDIFTQAWAHPESSDYSDGLSSQQVVDVEGIFDGIGFNTAQSPSTIYGAPFSNLAVANETPIYEGEAATYNVSQRGLNLLKQIYNFSLRRAASGMRYVDQLLSRFGIRLNENEARRSVFLGSSVLTPTISRVDSTACGQATFPDGGTLRSALGDYTGRGQITPDNNGAHWHYKNEHNDFGMLLVVAHMMPRTNYYQGVKPHVNHLKFNDFFNPDLEDIGNAPIRNNEVFDDYVSSKELKRDNGVNSPNYLQGVFGWAPNYYDYKSQQSYLTGDFRCKSLNSVLRSFQLFRELAAPGETERDVRSIAVLNEQFQKFDIQNVKDYNRMWLTQTDDADHFIASFLFKVRCTRNCNSLGNSLLAELNEHGNDVGDLIKVRPNGKYF